MIYHRESKQIVSAEEQQDKLLHFLYHTVMGRILLKGLVARPWFSKLGGLYQKSRFSRKDILPFMEKHGIRVENPQSYPSFNEFFIRHKEIIRRKFNPRELLAIADSKLRYYPITRDLKLTIKESVYDLEEILEDRRLASRFQNGTCLVFRLSVDDYHRYHYIDSGRLISRKKIPGLLHTVRPVSEKFRVYTRNAREISLLSTDHMGEVVQIEVGALLVGKIVNHNSPTFEKMQEKGYFEFGGSTVVLLLNQPIQFDEDIAQMNADGIEIKVQAGERIGIVC